MCKEAMKKWRVLVPVGAGNEATRDSIYMPLKPTFIVMFSLLAIDSNKMLNAISCRNLQTL